MRLQTDGRELDRVIRPSDGGGVGISPNNSVFPDPPELALPALFNDDLDVELAIIRGEIRMITLRYSLYVT